MSFETPPEPDPRTTDSEAETSAEEDPAEDVTTRRRFLKGLLKAAALAGGAAYLCRQCPEEREDTSTPESGEPEPDTSPPEETETPPAPEEPPEEEEFFEKPRELKLLEDLIDPEAAEDIELTPEKMKVVTNYWKQRYTDENSPELRDSFHQAYREMQPWLPYLYDIFVHYDVPPQYLYLAIPESHWRLRAHSRAGAVGPYQFIKRTAKGQNLEMERNIDERQDPLKSADACARLLRDLYDRTGDWDLALSGYNGGFIWPYLKETSREDTSYADFLKYISEQINEIKNEIQAKAEHRVQEKENLRSIADDRGCSVEELCRLNDLKDPDLIKVGQKIRTPLTPSLKKEFWNRISGYLENLNYPPKFNAVWDRIQEGSAAHLIDAPEPPMEFDTVTAGQGSRTYTVEPGDTFYGLAEKHGLSSEALKEANPGIQDPADLKVGEEVIIPGQQISLKQLAKKKQLALATLEYLNPAVLNSEESLPEDQAIRVPRSVSRV